MAEDTPDPLEAAFRQPLHDVLARYRALAASLDGDIRWLEAHLGERPDPAPDLPEPPRTPRVAIEATTSDIDALLAFQEQLSELAGVARVTVAGAGSGRANFIVDLTPNISSIAASAVVCVHCGKTIREGTLPASHGLCPECQGAFTS